MNGIINILKPPGLTSHDVVSFLRRQLKIKRIGHTGTLDPQAAGVLPVCIGQATRLADFLSAKDKEYMCRMRLGIKTTTQDAWGEVIESKDTSLMQRELLEKSLTNLRGCIKQKVPEYSAVKVAGEPMYKKARRGESIEAIIREIYIYKLDLLEYLNNEVALHIHCSKGTYIRTLCSDLGDMLGVGGHMSFLVRTRVGSFKLQDSYTLEEVAERKEGFLLPVSKCIEGMPSLKVKQDDVALLKHGRSIEILPEYDVQIGTEKKTIDNGLSDKQMVAIIDEDNNLHALAVIAEEFGRSIIKPKKVFNMETDYANSIKH
ncbi:MAG: tRNA pseudouridine(55) synthase TruB [Firmicutes bacterium HGW-Firmicutes-12]|jgi:tRNA pseudouridine55 synthase|nr:MAG: tRNA pseudouridine(55) synthase TruB [Firmicutes bacterium HGW-Firmicutes-12]